MKVDELLADISKLAPDERINELEKLVDEIRERIAEESEGKDLEKVTQNDLDNVLEMLEETRDELSVLDSMLSEKRKIEDKNLEDIAKEEAVVTQKKREEEAIADLKRDENFYGKAKYQGDIENKNKLEFEAGKKQFYEKTAAEQLIEEHKQRDKYFGDKSNDYIS